jgi:hypothetical protein
MATAKKKTRKKAISSFEAPDRYYTTTSLRMVGPTRAKSKSRVAVKPGRRTLGVSLQPLARSSAQGNPDSVWFYYPPPDTFEKTIRSAIKAGSAAKLEKDVPYVPLEVLRRLAGNPRRSHSSTTKGVATRVKLAYTLESARNDVFRHASDVIMSVDDLSVISAAAEVKATEAQLDESRDSLRMALARYRRAYSRITGASTK